MQALQDILRDPLVLAGIPGLSLAALHHGELACVHAMGIRGSHDSAPVDAHTVFEAASLTKPVVSLIALQLVDEERLDLDAPLHTIGGDYVHGDARAQAITARHVLTHTSGLPNIVSDETPLKTYFPPGARFNYGSSAFAWLQRAMEIRTGRALEDLACERVFTVFGMPDSSLRWEQRFETNHAQGHDLEGRPLAKRRPACAAASWSLLTTATDYARFVQAVLQGQGLSPAMHACWLTPAVQAREGVDEVLNADAALQEDVAWGLGWGIEPAQDCFFHWGNIPGFRSFVMADRRTGDAVVWFANSDHGLRLAHRILPVTVPGHPRSLEWLQVGPP
ncbi:serine hydrolase domain-containing protein [Ramlibacter sp. AN1133]|uniref:serine hydrolase domain-containing protein n=1 Tax=Ramlibacter sp. AN1133 TaxID=3133429 RepID=UPI0030C283CF